MVRGSFNQCAELLRKLSGEALRTREKGNLYLTLTVLKGNRKVTDAESSPRSRRVFIMHDDRLRCSARLIADEIGGSSPMDQSIVRNAIKKLRRSEADVDTEGHARIASRSVKPLRNQVTLPKHAGVHLRRLAAKKKTRVTNEMSWLRDELHRVSAQLESREQELAEAIDQQAATSEILRVISRSPTDVQPVLDAIVESASRVCAIDDVTLRLREKNLMVARAHTGPVPIFSGREAVGLDELHVRWASEHGTLHIPDIRTRQNDFPTLLSYARTFLLIPFRQRGELIGTLTARRTEVRPFTPAQIKLLKTFADQAVIAIENVRLFRELEARTRELAQSVGELRALGEVGQAVSSTLDLQTVLSTIVRYAVQLSRSDAGVVYEYDEAAEEFYLKASHLMEADVVKALQATPVRPGQGATGRSATLRAPVQLPDILNEQEFTGTKIRPKFAQLGYRSVLAVPLLREERIMGALTVWRKQEGSFSAEVVQLLQTFATQSALAIQNARLFREIEDKSRQIETANRHKSEFLANMSHELRTPLNAIIGFSEVLLDPALIVTEEEQSQFLTDVLNSGKHLLRLINEILDLAKIEAGKIELKVASAMLSQIFASVQTIMRPLAAKKNIDLQIENITVPEPFPMDAARVKQVLINLLANAVKFSPEGGTVWMRAVLTTEQCVSKWGIQDQESSSKISKRSFLNSSRQPGTPENLKAPGWGSR